MGDLVRAMAVWPLYSVKRLVMCVVVFVVFIASVNAVSSGFGGSVREATGATSTASPSGSSVGDSRWPEQGSFTPSASASALRDVISSASPTPGQGEGSVFGFASDDLVVETAVAFVAAWARPTLSRDEWLSGVGLYSSESYLTLLSSTDPSRVPATRVEEGARLEARTAGEATVIVPTNAGAMRVSLVSEARRPVVASVMQDFAE